MALAELPCGEEHRVEMVAGGCLELPWVLCSYTSLQDLACAVCPSPRPLCPTRAYLSKAEPWLWLLVRREKTLRSLRGRVGGEEGGVKPTSGGLSQEG